MSGVPDSELFYLLKRFQSGDAHAIWLFAENYKIKAIIKGRIGQYRKMFHWLPDEDLEDVECGLVPRIYEIAQTFELPEQPNDGRIISYFNLRLKGEADFLLKKITNMKVEVDSEHGKTYLKSLAQSDDCLDEMPSTDYAFIDKLVDGIESVRQEALLGDIINRIPQQSNDSIWLRCYTLRMRNMTWAEIGKEIGYRQTDYAWLKENTARFVTRLKHKLILMGEKVSFRICGIYTDAAEVAIAILDSSDRKNNSIWSKTYDCYGDLDKVEAKLGDIFRQYDITYVVTNELNQDNNAFVIIMRYLTKRESFVETVNMNAFMPMISSMPESVNGIASTYAHKSALLLTHVKKAWLDLTGNVRI